MSLIACSECGTEISDKAATCPKCGVPVATLETKSNRVLNNLVAVIVIVIVGSYFWGRYGPVLGNYELKKDAFACSSEDEVVRVRGAKMFGVLALAKVLADADCLQGPLPVNVKQLAKYGSLINVVEIEGIERYVDHDGLAKR